MRSNKNLRAKPKDVSMNSCVPKPILHPQNAISLTCRLSRLERLSSALTHPTETYPIGGSYQFGGRTDVRPSVHQSGKHSVRPVVWRGGDGRNPSDLDNKIYKTMFADGSGTIKEASRRAIQTYFQSASCFPRCFLLPTMKGIRRLQSAGFMYTHFWPRID